MKSLLGLLVVVAVFGFWWLLDVAGAQSISLAPVVDVIDTGKGQVANVATAIALLLSALLAIALIVHLYLRSGGGK